MAQPLMACGHAAQGRNTATGLPCCAICIGLTADATRLAPVPDLTGRQSLCIHCGSKVPSSLSLAFFGYQPSQPFDDYYSGCLGFD